MGYCLDIGRYYRRKKKRRLRRISHMDPSLDMDMISDYAINVIGKRNHRRSWIMKMHVLVHLKMMIISRENSTFWSKNMKCTRWSCKRWGQNEWGENADTKIE